MAQDGTCGLQSGITMELRKGEGEVCVRPRGPGPGVALPSGAVIGHLVSHVPLDSQNKFLLYQVSSWAWGPWLMLARVVPEEPSLSVKQKENALCSQPSGRREREPKKSFSHQRTRARGSAGLLGTLQWGGGHLFPLGKWGN